MNAQPEARAIAPAAQQVRTEKDMTEEAMPDTCESPVGSDRNIRLVERALVETLDMPNPAAWRAMLERLTAAGLPLKAATSLRAHAWPQRASMLAARPPAPPPEAFQRLTRPHRRRRAGGG